jgi:hypothetical protein
MIDAAGGVMKDVRNKAGAGAGLGAAFDVGAHLVGIPTGGIGTLAGTALGGAGPVIQGVKDFVANKAMVAAVSPAAQAGKQKIASEMAKSGANNAARFGSIATYLGQTSPEARAAMNEDNPLNDQK